MPSLRTTIAAVLAVASFSPALADSILAGCYDNYGELDNYGVNTYQTQGSCSKQCFEADKAIFAVYKGSTCFCGDYVPTKGKVDESECNMTCQGFGQACGGATTWLFGYTGAIPPDVPKPSTTTTSSSSKSTSTKSSTKIAVQTTVVVQSQATVTAPPSDESVIAQGGKNNTAGIAAGAVVGVVAVVAIGLGAFLVMRRNRRRQAEEEYRAAVAAKEFTASIRKPMADARLDPVMLQHRRLSDGSIADNQDFSRRILKVTNPDSV